MSKQNYNAVLIGAGRIGAEPSERLRGVLPEGWLPLSHAEAMLQTGKIHIAAVCDMSEERLSKIAALYKIDRTYTDYKKMIDEIEPDIVSIATRTGGRTEIIRYAVEKGVKALYFEKPIANNVYDGKGTLTLCEKKGVKFLYGTTRRYMHIYQKAKELIQSGQYGALTQIYIEYGRERLMWTHPHFADMAIFFAGSTEWENVSATCDITPDSFSKNILDDDPFVRNAFVRFKNNITATFTSIPGSVIRLVCEKAVLSIFDDGGYINIQEIISRSGFLSEKIETVKVSSPESGTTNAFLNLISQIENGTPLITASEITEGMRIITAIAQSALKNSVSVSSSDVDEQLTITGKSGNFYA